MTKHTCKQMQHMDMQKWKTLGNKSFELCFKCHELRLCARVERTFVCRSCATQLFDDGV